MKRDSVALLEAKLLLGNTRDGVVDLYGVDMDLEWYIVCLKKTAGGPVLHFVIFLHSPSGHWPFNTFQTLLRNTTTSPFLRGVPFLVCDVFRQERGKGAAT